MRSPFIIATAAFLVSIAGGAAYWYANYGSPEAKFISACEDVLLGRLKSPSTYKRISVTELHTQEATLDEFLGIYSEEQRLDYSRRNAGDPKLAELARWRSESFRNGEFEIASIILDYDAANGFGTPIRGSSWCSVVVRKGADLDSAFGGPAIDGYTALDWSLKVLRDLRVNG